MLLSIDVLLENVTLKYIKINKLIFQLYEHKEVKNNVLKIIENISRKFNNNTNM